MGAVELIQTCGNTKADQRMAGHRMFGAYLKERKEIMWTNEKLTG